ncbi:MAG: T9SS type A sorting domain-containing protein [Bacteroidales bacterium]|nr:T9SS type A sorting domain-containing protein [Bacteroidales bacterium]MCF8454607.1 T9SS type A sorting domain-containing protein [Bacteroidales bacterium]
MKIVSLTGLVFLLFFNANGQSVSPNVVAGSGDFYESANASISWTLGETVIKTLEGQNAILTQGFQQSWANVSCNCQNLYLPLAWSLFSTYIDPTIPAIDSILAPIVSDVNIVKNGMGQVYWPQYNINMIGNLTIGKGYQIKMFDNSSVDVCGVAVVPETVEIPLPQAWSILGYLRQTPGDAVEMMSCIASELSIAKNGNGLVYWPIYSLNQIGNLNPGEGYQVKLNSPQTFIYPPNSPMTKTTPISTIEPKHFQKGQNTGSNMTVGIPLSAWETMPAAGDELAVKTRSGRVIGSSVFTGKNMAIAVWGNDDLSKDIDGMMDLEAFSILLWSNSQEREFELKVINWQIGDALFSKDKISVVDKCNIVDFNIDDPGQIYSRPYPNPFTDVVCLEFYLPGANHVSIKIYNALGEIIANPVDQDFDQGLHQVNFNRYNLPPGNYYYRLITNSRIGQGKLIIL